jgi:3-hydroxyacyl-[acyl-carrier-protein] dehydratase
MAEGQYQLNIDQIRNFLPHRAPFLLVDRILSIEPTGRPGDLSPENDKTGTRVVALKSVSYGEPFFQGHFPEFSVMPGVLVIETMAQAASFSVYPYLRDANRMSREFSVLLVGVEGARFRRPVVPGDQLRIETTVTKSRGRLWVFQCVATVEGQRVAEAEILANLISSSDSESGKGR